MNQKKLEWESFKAKKQQESFLKINYYFISIANSCFDSRGPLTKGNKKEMRDRREQEVQYISQNTVLAPAYEAEGQTFSHIIR